MAIVITMALKITDGKLFLERHAALLKTNHIFDTVRRQLRGRRRLNFNFRPSGVDPEEMVVFIFSVDSIRVKCMQFPVCCFHQRGETPRKKERGSGAAAAAAGRWLDGHAANSFSTSALTLQRSVNARACSNVSGARTISALAIRALAEHVAPERSSGQRVRVAPQKKLDSGRLAMENFWTLPDTWRDSILRRASKRLAI